MPKFSDRFKQLRTERRLSQQNLADQLGFSKSSVNMYERGEREPGLESMETIADYFNEEKELYVEAGANIRADFCLKAKGDSMIGARIYDGDIVFIRKQEMVNNGEIAAVIIDDEATLKRVNYYPEKNLLILKAENSNYEDLVYTGEQLDHVIILGKAVAFQSDVR